VGGPQNLFEINNILAQLQLRSGACGIERKNLINTLFKNAIDSAFPTIVKYIFWACEENLGIFEPLSEEDFIKFRRMSKYKRMEVTPTDNEEAENPDEHQSIN
jgi:hypothetical protein